MSTAPRPLGARGRLGRDPRAGLIGVAVIAGVVFVALAAVALLIPAWHGIDAAISSVFLSYRQPWITGFAIAVTQLGSAPVVIGVTLAATIWLAVKRRTAAIVYLIATVGGGWFLGVVIVQNLLHRTRPVGVNLITIPAGYSMPSGHSLSSFLLYASLAVIITLNAPTGRRTKRWVGLGAAAIIVLVGWSRIYLGVHWFGDVLAAWLFGGAWWAFTTATYLGSVTSRQREHARDAR